MQWFVWMGNGEIPAQADLRQCGWRLHAGPNEHAAISEIFISQSAAHKPPSMPSPDPARWPDCPILLEPAAISAPFWRKLAAQAHRRWIMAVGVDNGVERARLIQQGFGDALGADVALAEVQARASRIVESARALQRWRRLGLLRLDLVAREAYVATRPLGLHPREFALLWRLLETPGLPVEKAELLRDVWQISYMPETNSMAVHASRLRAKMAAAGLSGWIRTTAAGGYCIAIA